MPGELAARISTSSVGEYADRYDVLYGAREELEDDDDFIWAHHRINPWAWDRKLLDGDELEEAREALDDLHKPWFPETHLDVMENYYGQRVAELEKRAFAATPYQAIDRPGEPNLAALIWAKSGVRGGANTFDIPAPCGGDGSWTDLAGEAWRDYVRRWPFTSDLLRRDDFAIDIAIGADADRGFDVDNLAARVLKGMRRAVPDATPLDSYRVYRRASVPDTVVVTLQHPERAQALRRAMRGRFLGLSVDPDARIHHHRPTDAAALVDFEDTLRDLNAA